MIDYLARGRDFKKVVAQIQQMEEWIFPLNMELEEWMHKTYGANLRYNHLADFREGVMEHHIFMFVPDEQIKQYYDLLFEVVFEGNETYFDWLNVVEQLLRQDMGPGALVVKLNEELKKPCLDDNGFCEFIQDFEYDSTGEQICCQKCGREPDQE